ncbi:MAG: FHA domain-containing serine/threonine-protein kinase [Candidatus Promineifilaceae bacterium]
MDWVGREIDGYQIKEVIGTGGMATVYRAFQPQLERWVAVKVLTSTEAGNTAFLRRFQREAKAIAALHHPNILTIHDYGEKEGLGYIVMEYVSGGTLKNLLNTKPMTWTETATLILPVARALAYAHSRKILHCDIKPANILLYRQDWPLLADFGLFQMRGMPDIRSGLGFITGTPAYVSPEQLLGEHVGRKSDVYSLGVVLYEMLTGRLPFRAASTSSMMLQRLVEAPPSMSLFNDQIDPELESAILKALSREPDQRYRNMDDMVNALARLARDIDIPSIPPPEMGKVGNTTALKDHPDLNGPHLIITGTETVIPLPLQKEVTLGRNDPRASRQPEINLDPHGGDEAGVSRFHARLRYTAMGWLLEDLNSTNGTSLNMSPIKAGEQHSLKSGDVIRCGRLMMVFYEQ